MNDLYAGLGGSYFDERQYQMDLMKRMAAQQVQANGLTQALGMQQYAQPRPIPNPEPNKVLLLLGDDE